MNKPELFDASYQATYCPEDNKLRLYVGRVPRPEYDALRAEGWTSTPKQSEAGQGEFAATWTTDREDTALSYAGVILDEDAGPGERAADRAKRFGGYLEKRTEEATGHADGYAAGPQAHGYQNEARAERSAARHDRIADRACNSWDKAEYWQRRTAGVIGHALYVSGPGVRMGRIKVLETEQRKADKNADEYAKRFAAWTKTAALEDPAEAYRWAYAIANSSGEFRDYQHPRPESATAYEREHGASLWSLLTHEPDPITGKEAAALWLSSHAAPGEGKSGCWVERWRNHYANRLAYERQMLESQGGRAGDLDIEAGGFIGGRQVQSVHKSNATGRVVSVKVWGSSTGYTEESGYSKRETRRCLVKVDVERLSPGAYRAPTDDERSAFVAGQKAEKASKPAVAFINPTPEDADRLQSQMNAEAAANDKTRNYPRKPGTVDATTQAEYSASYKDYKAVREFKGGVKIRVRVHGWQHVESVVVLTDKPQKPLPASVWQTEAAGQPATVQPELAIA